MPLLASLTTLYSGVRTHAVHSHSRNERPPRCCRRQPASLWQKRPASSRIEPMLGRPSYSESSARLSFAVWDKPRGPEIVITFILLFAVFYDFLSEELNCGGGFGMDGQLYGKIAQSPSFYFADIKSFYNHRFLPSLFVHFGLRITGVPLTSDAIIRGFIGLNVLNLAMALFLWLQIARLFA